MEAPPRIQHAHRNSLNSSAQAPPQANLQAMPVPPGPHRMNGNGQHYNGHIQHARMASGGYDMPRSPPHDKNTAHVPCKFFRLGKCTYGDACPFEHSVRDSTEAAPCKYFAKGNCKFGQKCALAHILPDGRRINGPNAGMEGQFGHGGSRMSHNHFSDVPQGMYRPSNIALQRSAADQQYGYVQEEPMFLSRVHKHFDPVAVSTQIDNPYSSHQSHFGPSPPTELTLATSPQGARALDAPLPASFDATNPPNFARNGFAAASVPTGWLRPTPASPTAPLEFGNLNGLTLGESRKSGDRFLGPASPSSTVGEGLFPRRAVPISSRSGSKLIAASFDPRDIWGSNVINDDDPIEEDLVPTDLGLLTDEEKIRRFSRTEQDSGTRMSAVGSPTGSKVGSPVTASPSRFGAFFAKRTENGELGGASPVGVSPFGHIGSPLRKFSMTAEPNGLQPPADDASPHLLGPLRHGSTGMLSQQLGRTRLSVSKTEAPETSQLQPRHPGALRTTSNSSVTSSGGGGSSRMNRAVSSTSVGRDKIDEDIFEMEEEDDEPIGGVSGGGGYGGPNIWSMTPAERPLPNLGAIGEQQAQVWRTSTKETGK